MGEPPAIRASDAERQRAILVLRDAVVEGRLTLDEYGDRVEHALKARTDQDLAQLTRDLPSTPAPAPAPVVRAAAPAQHQAIFSHLVRRGPLRLSPHEGYLSLFGTIDLDLREATLHGREVELSIRNIFGTVTVLVPEGVDVTVHGGGWLSSQYVDTSISQQAETAVVHIHLSGGGGTLYVRNLAR